MAIGKLLWVVVFASLYGFGGIKNKWKRRYLAPFWMGCGIWLFSFLTHSWHWWYLLYPLLLCGFLHIGYGGSDDTLVKLRKRAIYGLCLGIAALPLVFGNYLWLLFVFHCVLCVASSVVFGVWNPFKNARSEESAIALLSTVLVLFLI